MDYLDGESTNFAWAKEVIAYYFRLMHAKVCFGRLEGMPVVAMQGRFHYYEGYSMQELTFPVRVYKALGVGSMIVTNACGGINPDFYPGALMFITDHINFTGDNPLMGHNHDALGPKE